MPFLPHDIRGGVSVPYQDTLMIVGGYRYQDHSYLDTIYYFDVQEEDWKDVGVRMKIERDEMAAFLVPDHLVDCS